MESGRCSMVVARTPMDCMRLVDTYTWQKCSTSGATVCCCAVSSNYLACAWVQTSWAGGHEWEGA
eukprot:3673848-Alexandrium_andersonii.AAC.1